MTPEQFKHYNPNKLETWFEDGVQYGIWVKDGKVFANPMTKSHTDDNGKIHIWKHSSCILIENKNGYGQTIIQEKIGAVGIKTTYTNPYTNNTTWELFFPCARFNYHDSITLKTYIK